MATIKIILRKKHNADGTVKLNKDGALPLTLRVTKDRKTNFIYLGYSCKESDWDEVTQRVKRSHPNHVRLNNYIIKKLSQANDSALELESSKKHVTSKSVAQKIKPRGSTSFYGQAKIYIDNLERAKKHNQWSADKPRLAHFKAFLKNSDIGFEEINPTLLKQFAAYLKDERQMADRSIMNNMVFIRSVFSQAIASEVTDARYYPFGKGKFKIKFPDSLKIGLTAEEVQILEEKELPDPRLHHARNLFLFSFYLAGMRISDVFRLKWSDFKDGRLYYLMGKNGKGDSLKVPEKALKIIGQYRREEPKHDLVFPDLETVENIDDDWEVQKQIKSRTHLIGEYLISIEEITKIDKKIRPHIARHTFGNISGNQIPVKTLQKLYRHTHLSTTANYQQNFSHDEIDNALDKVIGAVAIKPQP